MKTTMLITFGIISIVIGLLFLVIGYLLYKKSGRAKRVLSSVHIYTIGIFISVVLALIPVYYTSYKFGDSYDYIRPFLLALYNSMRVFIVDGDYEIIIKALKGQPLPLRVSYSLYTAILFVAAPILTFSNVLSLFKNIKGEFRYWWHKYKKHYIMSELNVKSIALAKNIRALSRKAVIVFTDVFEQNEEDDYELLTEARDINAICLKKDIAHLNIISKKGDVEIFLIGENESENVSQAVKITTELNQKNTKHNVKIFVFSQSQSGAYLIDSVKYDNLLEHAGRQDYNESSFKLRRINEKQQLIWNTVPKMKLFDIAQKNNKTLSVLIAGFGSYGMEFFKTVIWYCQFEGYKLQINIIDNQGGSGGEKSHVEALIDKMCPELMKTNCSKLCGEAQYDIEIFSEIDMQTSDLDDILLYDGEDTKKKLVRDRLRSTDVALIALGNDDVNIEVAVQLRSLFDRVNGIRAKKDIKSGEETVDIYSVVYDGRKSAILCGEEGDSWSSSLVNYKDIPYNIRFIGAMSSQFAYENIYNSDLEKEAYKHHIAWVETEEKIYNEWESAGDLKNLEKHDWYYTYGKSDEAKAKDKQNYEKYEYYRLSSIAREMYLREINNNAELTREATCLHTGELQTCGCENCVRRKRSEHMRWNAYMRIMGYSYDKGIRADRAKLHDNLCDWDMLSELDKLKD